MHFSLSSQRDIAMIYIIMCDTLLVIAHAQCRVRKNFSRTDQLRISEPNKVDIFFNRQKCHINQEIAR